MASSFSAQVSWPGFKGCKEVCILVGSHHHLASSHSLCLSSLASFRWASAIESMRYKEDALLHELTGDCPADPSPVRYKEDYKRSKDKFSFVPDAPYFQHIKQLGTLLSEIKYKEATRGLSSCLYAQMPETIETVFAREVAQNQSEKRYKHKYEIEKGKSSYSSLKEPPDVKHAMDVHKHQSDVSYRKGLQDLHKHSDVPDRPDIKKATEVAKLISDVRVPSILGRPDIEHVKGVSKLTSQVKYKEKFEKELREQKHRFNPQESATFRQAQAAALWASDYEYRRQYERSKGRYHFTPDTAEQRHLKDNVALQSQVKYKEDYEKSKGKSMLEFTDTQGYQVSKEAQKVQSKVRKYEEAMKGKSAMDFDLTPAYLHAKHAASLLNEKEYKKDLEMEIKGRGMEVSADMPDIQRAKKASLMASEVRRWAVLSLSPRGV
uniref:Nebulette n=1 Tax=Erpetoichthys calabaricus TaxID=27687 RepID=A0A8C4RRB4_ERPCA